MKKKKNAILQSQIEQYEKLLNEVSKDADEENQSEQMKQTSYSATKNKSGTPHFDIRIK